MEQLEHYILFHNVTEGLQLEKKLKENSIGYIIAPTPRELSKCCGIAIKYLQEDEPAIKEIIAQNAMSVAGFHSITKKKLDVK